MDMLFDRVEQSERYLIAWLARHSITLLRLGMGIVYVWFGVLKFFPGASPAQDLAIDTISRLTFGMLPGHVSLLILANWECLIGLGFLTGRWLRITIIAQLLQMLGTVTPLVFFPHATFIHLPYAPTLEGQYIIKNIVLITAALVIGATVRGGRLIAESTPQRGSSGAGDMNHALHHADAATVMPSLS